MEELLSSALSLHHIALFFWAVLGLLHLLVIRNRLHARGVVRRFRLLQPLLMMALFMLFFTGILLQTFTPFSWRTVVMSLLFGVMIATEVKRYKAFKALEPESLEALAQFATRSRRYTAVLYLFVVLTYGVLMGL